MEFPGNLSPATWVYLYIVANNTSSLVFNILNTRVRSRAWRVSLVFMKGQSVLSIPLHHCRGPTIYLSTRGFVSYPLSEIISLIVWLGTSALKILVSSPGQTRQVIDLWLLWRHDRIISIWSKGCRVQGVQDEGRNKRRRVIETGWTDMTRPLRISLRGGP